MDSIFIHTEPSIALKIEVIQLVATLPVLTKITKNLSISVLESLRPCASLWRADRLQLALLNLDLIVLDGFLVTGITYFVDIVRIIPPTLLFETEVLVVLRGGGNFR
jgi:hypothetical protein